MNTNTEKLNELIKSDFELKSDLNKIIDIDDDDDYEKTLNVTQLQIINKLLEYYEYEPIFDFIDEPS